MKATALAVFDHACQKKFCAFRVFAEMASLLGIEQVASEILSRVEFEAVTNLNLRIPSQAPQVSVS